MTNIIYDHDHHDHDHYDQDHVHCNHQDYSPTPLRLSSPYMTYFLPFIGLVLPEQHLVETVGRLKMIMVTVKMYVDITVGKFKILIRIIGIM